MNSQDIYKDIISGYILMINCLSRHTGGTTTVKAGLYTGDVHLLPDFSNRPVAIILGLSPLFAPVDNDSF